MILPDTSVWIDHLRVADGQLTQILARKNALCHPFVIGEIALGAIPKRESVLRLLRALRQPQIATHDEVLQFIEQHSLFRRGIGFVDAHLLASVLLTPEARLWTRDKRLRAIATELGVCITPAALVQ